MCYSLLKALLLQELDDSGEDGVTVWAVYERFEHFLDGSSRFAVFVQRIGLEQDLEEGLEVLGGECLAVISVYLLSICIPPLTIMRDLVLQGRQLGDSALGGAGDDPMPQVAVKYGLRISVPIHVHIVLCTWVSGKKDGGVLVGCFVEAPTVDMAIASATGGSKIAESPPRAPNDITLRSSQTTTAAALCL